MILENLREEVLEAARSLKKFGLVWMAGGTVCARDAESGAIVVTPSGMPYEDLTPADMVVTDAGLNLIEGNLRPSVALNLWVKILKERPDMHAVVHTHSPYATSFSVANQPVPVVTETMADWFGQPVRVSKYYHVEAPEFLSAPLEALGDGFAVLLGRHGPITIGKTIADALERAVTLEESAQIYVMAKVLGTPEVFSAEEAVSSFEYYHHRYGQGKG
jgi:L-fuculose-phosphate aldolase/L-ribulose-5-phosphate 4-epimerase